MIVLFNNCHGRKHAELFGPGVFYDLGMKEAHQRALPGILPGTECIVVNGERAGDLEFVHYSFAREEPRLDGNRTVRVFFGDLIRSEVLPRSEACTREPYAHFFDKNGHLKRLSALRVGAGKHSKV
jgi:hypothetical protein